MYLRASAPRLLLTPVLAVLVWALALPLHAAPPMPPGPGEAGPVHLVRPESAPKGLLLYLSGTRGWDQSAAKRAQDLAQLGYLVAGIEPGALQPPTKAGVCWNLAADLTGLVRGLGGAAALPEGTLPVLVGEGEGAALVYMALAQAPRGTVHAGLTVDFCPLAPSEAQMCPVGSPPAPLVEGGRLRPVERVETPWFALATRPDPACPQPAVADFVSQVGNARLVSEEAEADHGAASGNRSDPLAALLQWLDPRIPNQVAIEQGQRAIAGLPLTEVPATKAGEPTLAVMLSGDGGWAALDRAVAAELAAQGIATVGWDSLGYYWKARSPEEAARDLARLLRHYLHDWGKRRVVLIGYSFGADVLPFLVNRLPPDLRAAVVQIVFLGLGPTASFEFHLTDWLSSSASGDSQPVLPEVRRLADLPRLCVYGDRERGSLCPELGADGVVVRELPGDHHFGGDYSRLAGLVIEALRDARPEAH